MKSCPNIAGREIKRRIIFGYLGLLATLSIIVYNIYFDTTSYLKSLIFISIMCAIVPFLEVKSETCIVNAFFGINNMGEKYQKEYDKNILKIQRKISYKILLKSVLMSILATLVFLYI